MCSSFKHTIDSKLLEILLDTFQLLVKISLNLHIGILPKDIIFYHIVNVSQSFLPICSVIRFHIAVYYVDRFNPGLYYCLPSNVTAKGLDVFDLMASLDACPTSSERFMHSLAVMVFSQCQVFVKLSFLETHNIHLL